MEGVMANIYVPSILNVLAMVILVAQPTFITISKADPPSIFNTDFCNRALEPKKTCPTPPTPSSLDLNTLLGSYYEIGSTAHYKLRNELGMACTHTNFSLDTSASSENIVTVNVLTSGVPVVQGQQTLSALTRIASLSASVCSSAARMCSMISPQSKIYDASLRVSGVAQALSSSNPIDASTLDQVVSTLNASVGGIHSHIERLSRSINIATGIIASSLNQGAGATAVLDPVLRAVRASVGVATNDVTELASLLVYNLTFSSSVLNQVISHLPATAENSDVRGSLGDALSLINQEIDDVIGQVTALQSQLITIEGPLVEMMAADYRTSRPMITSTGTNLHAATNKSASPRVEESRRRRRSGHAKIVRLSKNDGSMMMESMSNESASNMDTSGSTNDESTTVSTTALAESLQIIALEGGVPANNLGEYSVLLAYTCDANNADQDRGPITDLLLLSRTPTLPPATVISLLNTAALLGIYTDCDNPFVPTVQRPDNCAYI